MTGNVSRDLSIGERKHPVKVASLSADANLTTGKSKSSPVAAGMLRCYPIVPRVSVLTIR